MAKRQTSMLRRLRFGLKLGWAASKIVRVTHAFRCNAQFPSFRHSIRAFFLAGRAGSRAVTCGASEAAVSSLAAWRARQAVIAQLYAPLRWCVANCSLALAARAFTKLGGGRGNAEPAAGVSYASTHQIRDARARLAAD